MPLNEFFLSRLVLEIIRMYVVSNDNQRTGEPYPHSDQTGSTSFSVLPVDEHYENFDSMPMPTQQPLLTTNCHGIIKVQDATQYLKPVKQISVRDAKKYVVSFPSWKETYYLLLERL